MFAAEAPQRIARVAVDVSLAHLDRLFDYLIPESLVDEAVPGCSVRVRFAGQLVHGWLVEIADTTDVTGTLSPLEAVGSSEPIMTSTLYGLLREVADHYAGTFADMWRLAIPPRHATTEKAKQREWPEPTTPPASSVLAGYPAGPGFCDLLASGAAPRATWQVAPVHGGAGDWVGGVLETAAATLTSGRSVVVVVPDHSDLERVRVRFSDAFGAGAVAVLHNDLGRSVRYRHYLACARGQARIVVGTRSAVYAPVHDPGLIVIYDDGDDLLAEQRAPYPHAREVAALRCVREGAGLLLVGPHRTAEVQAWVERHWVVPIELRPHALRALSPAVRVTGDSDAALARDPLAKQVRLPRDAFALLRDHVVRGPVLVQVPRAGYAPSLTCQACRTPVRCDRCGGPLRRTDASSLLSCAWCGQLEPNWRCSCGSTQVRAPVVGATRTSVELGRAFPGVRVIDSSAGKVVAEVSDEPAIVVATPGAEPVAASGYAAALLLDTDNLLTRPDLRAGEEALRRWLNATALVRSGAEGGTVLAVGESSDRVLQSLVRLDAAAAAEAELAARRESGFPPAVKMVAVTGTPEGLRQFTEAADLGDTELIGPVPRPTRSDPGNHVLLLRGRLSESRRLVAAVKAAMAIRSARKDGGGVRARVDPIAIG